MKQRIRNIFFTLLAISLVVSCSTSKNSWLTRNTNAFSTRYNIYFNGYQAYKEGIDAINKSQKDNYSQLLSMYPISQHSNADVAKSRMDITIEKSRKAIKLKSIKAKPKKNFSKRKDPDYIAFMNKEEYNPMVLRSWLLLAQAEFHKADFLGAMGTYAYIIKHFGSDADIANEAQIGRSRCFAEMGWNYEAEDALTKIDSKNPLNKRLNGLYAAAKADLFLKEKRYAEAIPFLKVAAENENNRFMNARFNFILGQLCSRYNDNPTAFAAFIKAIRQSTTYTMELAARLQRAQVAGEKTEKVLAELQKMAKSSQNKEYVDQIYVVIGNIYLNNNQKDKAIESYRAAINSKTPDNQDKMTANIRLGDLFYNEQSYLKAQPCYAGAAKQIRNDNDDFERVTKRAEILNELAGYSNTVHMQDSLQSLANMTEEQRFTAINKIITNIRKAEEEATKAQLLAQQQQQLILQQANNNGFMTQQNIPTPTSSNNNWYFYNLATVQTGIIQFQQLWGNRKLEDDWRRTDKTSISSELPSIMQSAQTDVTPTPQTEEDKYKPEFYLAQLPSTPAKMAKSNEMISKALFNMGQLYERKLEDEPMAIATYAELHRRFGVDSAWIDAYYSLYRLNKKAGKEAESERYKTLIANSFPTSTYALMLGHPEYAQHQQEIVQKQDSLYEATFAAYTRNEFQTVINNYKQINASYPFAELMPKFSLLNALSIGKSGDQPGMKVALEELAKKYPQSDVIGMAKDILALMEQGKTVTKGSSFGNLTTLQQEVAKQTESQAIPQFTATRNNRHLLALPVSSDTIDINRIVYKVANYNFNRFVLKDFELSTLRVADNLRFILASDFPSFGEAHFYQQSMTEDPSLQKTFDSAGIHPVAISEENLKALQGGQTLDAYIQYYQNTLIPAQAADDNKK
jgi:tetratricopeptide (TPR) repeat protein